MNWRGKERMLLNTARWTVRTILGLLLCASLAVGASYLFSDRPWSIFLPILFVVVIVGVAARYGVTVGILGSIVSAVIFAHLLFSPLHSLYVENDTARASLAWMVLGGIAIPYLVLPGLRSRGSKKDSDQPLRRP